MRGYRGGVSPCAGMSRQPRRETTEHPKETEETRVSERMPASALATAGSAYCKVATSSGMPYDAQQARPHPTSLTLGHLPQRGRLSVSTNGCCRLFEEEERRRQTAFFFRLRLVAMLPDGGFGRSILAGSETNPPRPLFSRGDAARRIRLPSDACEPSDTSRDFGNSLHLPQKGRHALARALPARKSPCRSASRQGRKAWKIAGNYSAGASATATMRPSP